MHRLLFAVMLMAALAVGISSPSAFAEAKPTPNVQVVYINGQPTGSLAFATRAICTDCGRFIPVVSHHQKSFRFWRHAGSVFTDGQTTWRAPNTLLVENWNGTDLLPLRKYVKLSRSGKWVRAYLVQAIANMYDRRYDQRLCPAGPDQCPVK